jgi:hypothetical protein
MRDLIGNKLEVGNLVYCPSKQQICKVKEVREPKLSNDDPVIVLELSVPLLQGHRGMVNGEAVAFDFVRVMDPNSEEVLSKLVQ